MLPTEDLRTLCLVNKSWRTECEPYLYAHFECLWWPQRLLPCSPSLVRFVRTILTRPELGGHVRSLLLKGDCEDHRLKVHRSGTVRSRSPAEEPARSLAEDAIEQVCRDHALSEAFVKQWKDSLYAGSADAYVTLLVSNIQQLQTLSLGDSYTGDMTLLGHYILNLAMQGRSHLFGIKDVSLLILADDWENSHFDGGPLKGEFTGNLTPFFYFGTVKRLSVALSNPELLSWPIQREPDLSNIVDLHLQLIRESHLRCILGLTTRLRTFRYDWFHAPYQSHTTDQPTIDLDLLIGALSLVKSTLQHLDIRAYYTDEHDPHREPLSIRGSMQPLAAFAELYSLTIPMLFLAGDWGPPALLSLTDATPHVLRYLTITDELQEADERWLDRWDGTSVTTELCIWSQTWTTTHPDLQSVRLLAFQNGWRLDGASREKLFEAGTATGVEIQIQSYLPHQTWYEFYKSTDPPVTG